MTRLYLRIPEDLKREARVRAAVEGVTMSDWIRKLMRKELETKRWQ